MKRAIYLTLLILLIPLINLAKGNSLDGQIRAYDGTARDYSLYFPSSYNGKKSMPLMVSFHPYGKYRWNAKSWRDTLQNFAEANQVILLCPDGGLDGRTDQADDLSLALQLVQSTRRKYNIDAKQIYAMGHSWGAKAALKFGLSHPEMLNGLLLVGMSSEMAASEFAPFYARSRNMRIYILHGQYDSPTTRFQPLHDQLMRGGACLEFEIMKGVGHTIHFAGRDNRLSKALKWIQQSPCYQIPQSEHNKHQFQNTQISIYPNPSTEGASIWIGGLKVEEVAQIRILNRSGILTRIIKNFHPEQPIRGLSHGDYVFVFMLRNGTKVSKQVLIR
ncbi:MAG: hypothetical protein AAF927_05230 [Bacteroidota bacterium]